MTQKDLVDIVAKAWNTLDAKLIEPYLSDDFYYESVWVFKTMKGKDAYMDYLTEKSVTCLFAIIFKVSILLIDMYYHVFVMWNTAAGFFSP